MGKGFKLDFGFIPIPEEVLTTDPPLLQCEWQLLAYLLKQVRFGEELQDLADDEVMHGIFEDSRRKDAGCRLSRNGLKNAREALAKRGWLETENVSNDSTRPRWIYRLVLAKRKSKQSESKAAAPDDPERQLVSQRDSGTPSQRDTVTVTTRRPASQDDTCNKEVRKYKNLDQVPERRTSAAAMDTWDLRRWRTEMDRQQPSGNWVRDALQAAERAGVTPARLQEILLQFTPDDENVKRLTDQRALFEPAAPEPSKPEPAAEPDAVLMWQEVKFKLEAEIPRHSFDTWIKPTRGTRIANGVLEVRVPTAEFRYIGTKFADQITRWLPASLSDVVFVAPEAA